MDAILRFESSGCVGAIGCPESQRRSLVMLGINSECRVGLGDVMSSFSKKHQRGEVYVVMACSIKTECLEKDASFQDCAADDLGQSFVVIFVNSQSCLDVFAELPGGAFVHDAIAKLFSDGIEECVIAQGDIVDNGDVCALVIEKHRSKKIVCTAVCCSMAELIGAVDCLLVVPFCLSTDIMARVDFFRPLYIGRVRLSWGLQPCYGGDAVCIRMIAPTESLVLTKRKMASKLSLMRGKSLLN